MIGPHHMYSAYIAIEGSDRAVNNIIFNSAITCDISSKQKYTFYKMMSTTMWYSNCTWAG